MHFVSRREFYGNDLFASDGELIRGNRAANLKQPNTTDERIRSNRSPSLNYYYNVVVAH